MILVRSIHSGSSSISAGGFARAAESIRSIRAGLVVLAAMLLLSVQLSDAANPLGIWRGTVKVSSGEKVAFQLEVAALPGQPATIVEGRTLVTGTLVNGDDRLASTDGVFDGQTLRLRYDFYDGVLTAKIDGDRLEGAFVRQWEKQTLTRDVHATRRTNDVALAGSKVDLTGDWILKVGEGEKQRLWRAAFKTDNGRATGTIIPVSGDWGNLDGTWTADQILTLNRFDGINARILKVTLQDDGTLAGFVDLGLPDPQRKVVAERITDRNQALVASLPNPNTHTRMSNATEPFKFSYPDLDGNIVAWNDARFKGKVVIVSITGTWCPTCHEEAPFLQDLYSRYQSQGLEIVALAFEYTGDVIRDRKQVGIFAHRHGVKYPMLLAGATDDAPKKLSQLVNFGAYPTAIFMGRDGLVKHIHAGFEGKATGERFSRLKADMEALVRDLVTGQEK
ncbi:MAG: TlpA family protein disulfide reductase [Opitutaceae bacterium]|nr:TlpA family protein disulfide reductase [Verrucomicrobiales bacterium]